MKTLFLRGFILKPTKRAWIFLKNGTREFQNIPPPPPFQRMACFYLTISESFERFQYLKFETSFLESEKFFKKLEYSFFVENTCIENILFPYESVISETNVNINRMMNKKWTYPKEWIFTSN